MPTNIALNQPTWQDSGWSAASRAIDGDVNGKFSGGSCTHTEEASTPHTWRVDLGVSLTNNYCIAYTTV